MLQINGVECLTLIDLSALSGVSVDALRQRQHRGSLRLMPFVTIHGKHYYRAEDVRALVRNGL